MPHRILVVDDEEPVLFAMRDYFSACGYRVDCAQELEEALALIDNIRYSIVFLDLRLTGIGGVEGLEIVAYVRERCPWTRVVILTAGTTPEVEKEAHRRNVDAFLHKPKPLPQLERIAYGLLETGNDAQNASRQNT